MSVLWYAIAIYMIGVATVLYIRPRIMFRENGMWKEFGLADADQTILPFWMFAIVWAILSYALATLILMFFATVTIRSSEQPVQLVQPVQPVQPVQNTTFMQPISTQPNIPLQSTIPNMNSRAPGYYILDPYANPAQPRYLYYGTEPPGFSV